MLGSAAITDRGSLTYLAFRNQSPYLKKYAKPTRVCFSNFAPFPKLKLSASSSPRRQIVPVLLANAHMDFSSSNQHFAHALPPLDPGSRRNQRPRKPVTVKAYYKDDNFSRIKYLPKSEERPDRWLMILACVPYLISLQMSEIGFFMKPFLEQHGGTIGETFINMIPGAANGLQHKFFIVYSVLGFAWIVKNRNLPHYFRFHMTMGMLLEVAMQIIWRMSEFFPLINYNGRLAMHYHMVISFSFICLLLECLRCAMAGTYPQIPIISDTAYIHTRFDLVDWP